MHYVLRIGLKSAVLALFAAGALFAGNTAAQGPAPERFMAQGNAWINSSALTSRSLLGKVVLVNFWTYSCINSLRALPYTESWAAKYKTAGLVVIGVHTPEFSFEKERPNVERAVRDLTVGYPVVMDSDYHIWQTFSNEYWPAFYLIDRKGVIRNHYFGEGEYADAERAIQKLLEENATANIADGVVSPSASGVKAAPDFADEQSPESYVGYARAEQFASPEQLTQDAQTNYTSPTKLLLNQWGLSGSWSVGAESAVPVSAPASIRLRFHSRDLHMVLGPTKNGQPVRFRIKLDGAAPGLDCGVDCTSDGNGEVRLPRLYQLVRQKGQVKDRTFEIQFLDAGVHAYVFTFG
jgi:thiol-disulfide isomerase/thioredoxin